MIVAVSASSGSMSAQVDERFGRAPWFVLYDTESGKFEAVSNPSVNVSHGAGPQTVNLLRNRGVGKVITGRVGPNARSVLEASGIEVVEGASGISVKEAVERFA